MAKRKGPGREQKIQESLEAAKQQRLAAQAQAAAPRIRPEAPVRPGGSQRDRFGVFWAEAKGRYGRRGDLEEVLWKHLVAAGFARDDRFEEGLRHFGLRQGE